MGRDGNAALDFEEFYAMQPRAITERFSTEQIRSWFDQADTDGNGTLDFEEFSQLARKGELVNRKLLNPKYRFLMQARHERAAERDAQAAALAAKKAQIEEAGRQIDETRAEWELVCAARRRDDAAAHRRAMAAKAAWLAERDRSGLHRQAMAAKRRAANLRTYRKNVTTGSDAVRAKRAHLVSRSPRVLCIYAYNTQHQHRAQRPTVSEYKVTMYYCRSRNTCSCTVL